MSEHPVGFSDFLVWLLLSIVTFWIYRGSRRRDGPLISDTQPRAAPKSRIGNRAVTVRACLVGDQEALPAFLWSYDSIVMLNTQRTAWLVGLV